MEKVGYGWTRSGDSWRAGDGVSVVAGDVAGSAAPTFQATDDLEEHEGSEGCSPDSIDLVNKATWCVHPGGKVRTLAATNYLIWHLQRETKVHVISCPTIG